MTPRYLTVDGMLSGTGVRDSVAGGYIDPMQLGLSEVLTKRIEQWLIKYQNAHYAGFEDKDEWEALDQEGLCIGFELHRELPQSKVEYYSHARQVKLPIPPPDSSPSAP